MRTLIKNILREQTENYKLQQANSSNEIEIIEFVLENFPNLERTVVIDELSNVNYQNSLIAISQGKIVGVLLLSDESLCTYLNSVTIIKIDNNPPIDDLCRENGIKGVVFAIDPKFRGSLLHYDFMKYIKRIITQYDYAYGLVYSFLRTHNYWKRMKMVNYATVVDDGSIVEIYLLK